MIRFDERFHDRRGLGGTERGNAATARDAFERALAEVETGSGREGLGQALYLQRDYSGAIKQHERMSSRPSSRPWSHLRPNCNNCWQLSPATKTPWTVSLK
jgi:hypothetical protein